MKLTFKIEQVALHPKNPAAAIELLKDMGADDWILDHVVAAGQVAGAPGTNEADLAFNYDTAGQEGKLELEVLHYTTGPNWMGNQNRVSHLGMHCTAAELKKWRAFFAQRNINVAQEVLTQSHTNEHIAGKRWYNYVIFDTYAILGVDIKFIVRLDKKVDA